MLVIENTRKLYHVWLIQLNYCHAYNYRILVVKSLKLCTCLVYFTLWFSFFCNVCSGIQGSSMTHDQTTMLELKSMFDEMKQLLNQQVTCSQVSAVR